MSATRVLAPCTALLAAPWLWSKLLVLAARYEHPLPLWVARAVGFAVGAGLAVTLLVGRRG